MPPQRTGRKVRLAVLLGAAMFLVALIACPSRNGREREPSEPVQTEGSAQRSKETAPAQPSPPAEAPPSTNPRTHLATPRDPCPGPAVSRQEFEHTTTSVAVVRQGAPSHTLQDAVFTPGRPFEVTGKFTYGPMRKDLEGEKVHLFVRAAPGPNASAHCEEWALLARAETNGAGVARFAAFEAPAGNMARVELRAVVLGDLSSADSVGWSIRAGGRIVVFDIDGTLTTGDDQVVRQVTEGHVPDMRPGAPDVARSYAERGILPLYLTGRPPILARSTRDWLRARTFPEGPIRTTDRTDQVVPDQDHVGRMKRDYLRALVSSTAAAIVAAYGNALTDVCAYAEAGIAPGRTFIVGPHAGAACRTHPPTQPVADYRIHNAELQRLLAGP